MIPNFHEISVLLDMGYVLENFHASKEVEKYEVCIEFCFGDYCVGLYKDKSLLNPKKRCKDFPEALEAAKHLEQVIQVLRESS